MQFRVERATRPFSAATCRRVPGSAQQYEPVRLHSDDLAGLVARPHRPGGLCHPEHRHPWRWEFSRCESSARAAAGRTKARSLQLRAPSCTALRGAGFRSAKTATPCSHSVGTQHCGSPKRLPRAIGNNPKAAFVNEMILKHSTCLRPGCPPCIHSGDIV